MVVYFKFLPNIRLGCFAMHSKNTFDIIKMTFFNIWNIWNTIKNKEKLEVQWNQNVFLNVYLDCQYLMTGLFTKKINTCIDFK